MYMSLYASIQSSLGLKLHVPCWIFQPQRFFGYPVFRAFRDLRVRVKYPLNWKMDLHPDIGNWNLWRRTLVFLWKLAFDPWAHHASESPDYFSCGFLIWPTFQGHRGQSSKFHRRVAYFVTIGPRVLCFGVMMFLGLHYVYTKFWSNRISKMATRGHQSNVKVSFLR